MTIESHAGDIRYDGNDGRNAVRVSATDRPSSPILRRFMAGYDRAFVLPNEREELAGFERCLALNGRHGPGAREIVAIIEDGNGDALAGMNFLAVAAPNACAPVPATIALNYVFVEAPARGRGMLRSALAEVSRLTKISLNLDPGGTPPAIFIEQNDPLRLSAAAYAADTRHTGLDQVDRLAIWAQLGARIVDFDYVQPALSEAQRPDDSLVYAALGFPCDAIPADLFAHHLDRFFHLSVLKGENGPGEAVAVRQLSALRSRRAPVALLPMAGAVARLRAGDRPADCRSFRELARETMADDDAGARAGQ